MTTGRELTAGRLVAAGSLVEGFHADFGGSALTILNPDAPRLAAYLAVFDVLLHRSAAGIEGDLNRFIAIRAINGGRCLSGPVSQGKLRFHLVFVVG